MPRKRVMTEDQATCSPPAGPTWTDRFVSMAFWSLILTLLIWGAFVLLAHHDPLLVLALGPLALMLMASAAAMTLAFGLLAVLTWLLARLANRRAL
jgi:hypothetical protein